MDKINKRVAVLIDAENVGSSNAKQIFDTMSSYGEVTIKQIFADWSNPQVGPWKKEIENFSIVANHQFSFVKGKNTSDLSLVIQAMIILYEKDVDTFCIVSSDSDLTRLVQELRERNKEVIGMGGRNSIKSFVNAFSEFIYLGEQNEQHIQDIQTKTEEPAKPVVSTNNHNQHPQPKPKHRPILEQDKLETMREIIERLIDETGHALYAQIATEMKNKYSDFVPKNYNAKSMKYLMEKLLPVLKFYDVSEESLPTNPNSKIMSLVKKKDNSKKNH